MDVPYNDFENLEIPQVLLFSETLSLTTPLPEQKAITVNTELPVFIYNFYNLDPLWEKEQPANRILLLEPSHFKKYPVSQNTINFVLGLSKNIKNIQIYIGEFNELISFYNLKTIYYKEHPLSKHYHGIEIQRDWMFDVKGYYSSFFAFWKKCKKEITF